MKASGPAIPGTITEVLTLPQAQIAFATVSTSFSTLAADYLKTPDAAHCFSFSRALDNASCAFDHVITAVEKDPWSDQEMTAILSKIFINDAYDRYHRLSRVVSKTALIDPMLVEVELINPSDFMSTLYEHVERDEVRSAIGTFFHQKLRDNLYHDRGLIELAAEHRREERAKKRQAAKNIAVGVGAFALGTGFLMLLGAEKR